MDTGNFPKSGGSTSATDKVVGAGKEGARTAEKGLNEAASSAASKIDKFRDEAAPALESASTKAREVVQKGKDTLTEATDQLRDRAVEASDAAAAYAKDEPMKALLIAAAAGALLMGLLSMLVRSDD